MKYIKGVYLNRYKRNLFNISMFLFLLMFLVLAVFVTVQAVVHIPRATINRISNKESGAKPGDIIRYTVKVKRLDTVQTERIRLVESLPSELEYLGNVSIDYGHITNFNEISVNDENYNLEFDIALIDYLPDMNGELTLSYDVRVLRESNTSPTINTLSHLYCYAYPIAQARPTVASESSGSFEDSVIYRKTSRLHMIKYIKDVISNNISAKIVWIDGVNLPEYVDVRLYKDDVPYSDFVRLTAANNWEYTWNVTYKDPSISTPSNSSPSTAATTSPVQWYVKQETVWDGYTSSLVVLPNNRYVFTNRYIADPAKPDSNNKTDNSDNNTGDNNNNNKSNNNSNSDNKNSNDNNNSNNSKNSNSNNNNESKKPSIPNATENRKEESGDIVSNEKLSSAVKSGKLIKAEVSADVGGVAVLANNVEDGAIINYHIKIENLYDTDLIGLRIREYMPEYTHYYSHSGSLGDYGYVNGKEHITWFIPVLRVGESINLEFKASKDYCVQGNISTKLYYEVTGSESKPYSNMARDPINVVKTE